MKKSTLVQSFLKRIQSNIFLIVLSAALTVIVFVSPVGSSVFEGATSVYTKGYESLQMDRFNELESITTDRLTVYSLYNSVIYGNTTLLKTSSSAGTVDPRVLAMRQFLIDKRSPLYPYADTFVIEADKYKLDWRLVASISGVESAFGTLVPYQSNNGWGWRGGPGGAYSIFPSWKDGIATVTSRLAIGYGTNLTPFQIEPAYCPPCYANSAHGWANGVTRFMSELKYYVDNLDAVQN